MRIPPIRRLRQGAGALLIAACGCTPIVTHPPHVERGVFVGGAFAIGPASFDSAGHGGSVSGVFQLSGVATAGWRSDDPDRPAILGSLRFPLYFGGGDLDAYLEAPERWLGGLDVGAGVDVPWANGRGALGYLQVGRRGTAGIGWFTTQGIGRLVAGDGDRSGLLWFPTLAYGGSPTRDVMGEVFITGVVGPQVVPCAIGKLACDGNYARPYLYIGIAAQGNLMRAWSGQR